MADASDITVGAVLQQYIEGEWHSIAYFSKKLRPAEVRYSAFDQELLAVYLAIKHFRHFVEGRSFHILTDHNFTHALLSQPDKHSSRQIHHLDYISQFTSDIWHIRSEDNTAADTCTLSRIGAIKEKLHVHVSTTTTYFNAIAHAQHDLSVAVIIFFP